MFGCCIYASVKLLDVDGKVDPQLAEALFKRQPDRHTIQNLNDIAKIIESDCDCECHRNIPGSRTLC